MMYFLLIFQLLTTEVPGWVQLGVYETEAQCTTVAREIYNVNKETTLTYICAPSKPEGKKV